MNLPHSVALQRPATSPAPPLHPGQASVQGDSGSRSAAEYPRAR